MEERNERAISIPLLNGDKGIQSAKSPIANAYSQSGFISKMFFYWVLKIIQVYLINHNLTSWQIKRP
jgi:hypothetical protein